MHMARKWSQYSPWCSGEYLLSSVLLLQLIFFYVFLCFRAVPRRQREYRVSCNLKKNERYNSIKQKCVKFSSFDLIFSNLAETLLYTHTCTLASWMPGQWVINEFSSLLIKTNSRWYWILSWKSWCQNCQVFFS